jgi:DUF2946 family protein
MSLSPSRQLAVSLALCAMLLRALLPDGWMPTASAAAAGSPFEICSVDGLHSGGKAPAQDQQQQRSHAPCAFAAAAPLTPPAQAATPAVPSAVFHIARAETAPLAPRAPPYRPNAARAPPAFS